MRIYCAANRLQPGLEWVASTLSAASLLSEIKQSSRRISELVAAITSYSRMDRASMQYITVTDGLESTLVMPGYKLGDRVTVVGGYGTDVPRIEAYLPIGPNGAARPNPGPPGHGLRSLPQQPCR